LRASILSIGLVSNPIEPRSATREYDPSTGDYTLYTTGQDSHVIRLLSLCIRPAGSRAQVLNPLVVQRQVHGGCIQGIGHALYECTAYASEGGELLIDSLMHYCLPSAENLGAFNLATDATPTRTTRLAPKAVARRARSARRRR
jgi:hypothetical protein